MDSHMDASTDEFRENFCEDTRRPDWTVTSPPYSNPLGILKKALLIPQVGVAFKLRLSFLEPTKSRGRWLRQSSRVVRFLVQIQAQGYISNRSRVLMFAAAVRSASSSTTLSP